MPWPMLQILLLSLLSTAASYAAKTEGAPPVEGAPLEGPTRTTSTTTDGLLKVTIDLNNDGVIEIINYYKQTGSDSRLLMRKELDLNNDGRVDMRSNFNEAGQLTMEEMDGDFDGKVDVVDEYRDGRRTITQVDTNFDGTFDMRKSYENGIVRRKERDTNDDGKMDFIEILDERGNVVQTGQDLDGNGKVDQRQD